MAAELVSKGAVRLFSDGRVRNPQKEVNAQGKAVKINEKGATEWYYTTEKIMQDCFKKFHNEFGDELCDRFFLREPMKLVETRAKRNHFVGEIDYNLENLKVTTNN